jgi:hypothetical protein
LAAAYGGIAIAREFLLHFKAGVCKMLTR